MTARHALREEQWARIRDARPGKDGDAGRSAADNRTFIEAVMWMARNGTRWRALPAEYGHGHSVDRRFRRWSRKGVWQMIFNTLAVEADTEWLMLDSTIVRAHQHAAGARKKRGAEDTGKPGIRPQPWGGHQNPCRL
jgi:transposase